MSGSEDEREAQSRNPRAVGCDTAAGEARGGRRLLVHLPVLLPIALAFVVLGPYFVSDAVPVSGDLLRLDPLFRPHLEGKLGKTWNPNQGDPIKEFYVQEKCNHDAFRAGRLDLWEPRNLCGFPDLASAESPKLYPPAHLLHRWVADPADAWTLDLLLHLVLGSLAAYGLFVQLGMRPGPSSLGAIVWMYNGWSQCWMQYQFLHMAAWLPVQLGLLERAMATGKHGWAVAAGVVGAGVLVSGHTQIAMYVFLGCGLWVAGSWGAGRYGRGTAARAAGQLSLMTVVAAGLAAPLILGHLELARMSSRSSDQGWSLVAGQRLPPEQLLRHVVPDLFGNPRRGYFLASSSDTNYIESQSYAGIATLFLAAGAIGRGMGASGGLALALAGLTLCMAMALPVYWPFYWLVPGMDRLRPSRVLFLYEFFLSLLAAQGAQRMLSDPDRLQRAARGAGGLAAFLAALGVGGFVAVHAGVADPSSLLPNYSIDDLPLGLPALVSCATALGFFAAARLRTERLRALVVGGVLAADLAAFSLAFNSWCPRQLLLPRPAAVARLQESSGGLRVTALGYTAFNSTLRAFDLPDIRGYVSLWPRWSHELLSSIAGSPGHRFQFNDVMLERLDFRLLRALAVGFVLSETAIESTELELMARDEVFVYRLRNPLPRARCVQSWRTVATGKTLEQVLNPAVDLATTAVLDEEPGWMAGPPLLPTLAPPVSIERDLPDLLELSAITSGPGLLVLADTYYPGWKATVNGQPERVLRANHALRAVPLRGSGKQTIRLWFEPTSWTVGLALSGLTLALVIASAAWAVLRAYATAPTREGTGRSPS